MIKMMELRVPTRIGAARDGQCFLVCFPEDHEPPKSEERNVGRIRMRGFAHLPVTIGQNTDLCGQRVGDELKPLVPATRRLSGVLEPAQSGGCGFWSGSSSIGTSV